MPQPTVLPRFANHQSTKELFFHILASGRRGLNLEFVSERIMQGANILVADELFYSNSILIWLIANSSIESIRPILEIIQQKYSLFPQILQEFLDLRDNEGKTALHLALAKGWNHRDDNSMEPNRPKMQVAIEALIEFNADPNLQDQNGNTILHLAVIHRDLDAVKYLLEHGADPNAVNKDGLTPIQMLRYNHAIASAFINKLAGPNTMLDIDKFNANLDPLITLLDNSKNVATIYDQFNDEVCKVKIKQLIKDLQILLESRKTRIYSADIQETREKVQRLLGTHLIDAFEPQIADSLDKFIKVVHDQNIRDNKYKNSKYYAIRLFDSICQFLLGLFGCDRKSLVNTAYKDFSMTLEQNTNTFMPGFANRTAIAARLQQLFENDAVVFHDEPILVKNGLSHSH